MTAPEPTNLVYDVAHDLQTPLTALKAQLSLITKSKGSKKIQVCHEIIDSMSSMVSDLLTYARSGTGFEPANQRCFDMSERINEALDYVETIAGSCGVTVIKDIESKVSIVGVPGKIDEAFLNVASNSMKYLKHSGRREIRITLARTTDHCRLSVEDSGIGIPADELEHVFTRFYRTRPAAAHASGSGLGLAITKRIVEMHGGTIGITSTEGVGTRVEILLPIDITRTHAPVASCQRRSGRPRAR